ncbi:hypothetical protein [Salinicoccus sp. RF5]|uniref:hypothetical protein n=1 Tax=Salinicoccus sp. RF5 TaxID=2748874 RepID=UPI001E61B170|nr:hypothetical protein [Salinicoccus sp. RF5]
MTSLSLIIILFLLILYIAFHVILLFIIPNTESNDFLILAMQIIFLSLIEPIYNLFITTVTERSIFKRPDKKFENEKNTIKISAGLLLIILLVPSYGFFNNEITFTLLVFLLFLIFIYIIIIIYLWVYVWSLSENKEIRKIKFTLPSDEGNNNVSEEPNVSTVKSLLLIIAPIPLSFLLILLFYI